MSKVCVIENSTSQLPQKVLAATKQWIYEICEKVARTHSEARNLAFHITLWLEYIILNSDSLSLKFSVPLCPRYIQLFALLLLDLLLENNEELRKRCPTANLLALAYNVFTIQEVYKLQAEVGSLDLVQFIEIDSLLKSLERILSKFPQTTQIRNVALILLDAYNLQFFGILADQKKVSAACLCVSRYWVLDNIEERWPIQYETEEMKFEDFKQMYEQMYCIAFMVFFIFIFMFNFKTNK